jgi:hypothetical protein
MPIETCEYRIIKKTTVGKVVYDIDDVFQCRTDENGYYSTIRITGTYDKIQNAEPILIPKENAVQAGGHWVKVTLSSEKFTGYIHSSAIPHHTRNRYPALTLDSKENKFKCTRSNNLEPIVTHFKAKRLDELNTHIQALKERTPGLVMCAITGVTGCGKSELAKAYTWKLSIVSKIFIWRLDSDIDENSNSTSKVSYKTAFFELLQNFGLQSIQAVEYEHQKTFQQRQNTMLWQKITQFKSWIIIFDNAGSEMDIKNYLPPANTIIMGQCLILITTPNPHFLDDEKANFNTTNAGLDPAEALQLFSEISYIETTDNPNANNLIRELDYSPLGIRVAGTYIHKMQKHYIRLDDHCKLLQSSTYQNFIDRMGGSEFIQKAIQDEKRSASLQAGLEFLIDRLKKINPELIEMLQYCSFLNNEDIPSELLLELCKNSNDDKIITQQRLAVLTEGRDNYSLLSYNHKAKTHNLHRTTQLVIRRLMDNSHDIIKKIAVIIINLYSYDGQWTENIKHCKKMEIHFSN